MSTDTTENAAIIDNLINLLNKGNAHISLDEALKNIPFEILGERPNGLPYSIWQLTEHIRIAQSDILNFSKDSQYRSPNWPDDYWPKETKPASEQAWENCIRQIKKDRESFINLLRNSADTLFIPFEYGDGQTLLREALVLADHQSYHTGEIMIIRRILKNWPV
ncbi:MAG TPA: DinB family protein [Hanamia sp.]|nr:DinB family protein [Hanamia sp.]